MIETAQEVAERLLRDVGSRLAHTRCVARQAADGGRALEERWAAAVHAAAWLHDIGYSPVVANSGLHALDGARRARAEGFDGDVCSLVAWHTGAVFEARVRGLQDELQAEFAQPPTLALDVLTWADLTSSPTGQLVSTDMRLEEIFNRYQPGCEVHRAITTATSHFRHSVDRVEQLRGTNHG